MTWISQNFNDRRARADYSAWSGEIAGNLPPRHIGLFVALKTAKTLGLSVPQSLLARADEVIE